MMKKILLLAVLIISCSLFYAQEAYSITRSTTEEKYYDPGGSSQPDVTPPTGTIIINDDTEFTNSANVTLTLSAQDNPGGSGIGSMKFSNDGVNWSVFETYATTKEWTLASGDGEKDVFVTYRDNRGNESAPYSDTIILDTVAPTQVTVTDDGDNTTDNTQLHATWTESSDSGSGIGEYQYAIGTSSGASDILDWTSAALNTTITHTGLSLTHGPLYYISVRVIDNAGNTSNIASSDGISYGTPPVISTISATSAQNLHQGWPVTIQATATDADNDTIEYRYLLDGSELQAWTTSNEYIWNPQESDIGLKTITVEVRVPRETGNSLDREVYIFRQPITPS